MCSSDLSRHAMSGVDMALWDIKGKAAGKPVRRLLKESAVDAVPAYASVLWPERPEGVAASAAAFLEQGYRAVKYGWAPMGPDAALDEALVAAARQALGAEVELMVDAGRAWDAETALERAKLFAPYAIAWLEEPLQPYDNEGFARLCAESPVPIATGEVLALQEEYRPLVEAARVHVEIGRAHV